MFFFKKKKKTVTFATCVWENDWRQILLSKDYLKKKQIENHNYNFDKKILIINNIDDYQPVIDIAKKKIRDGVLTDFYIANDHVETVLKFFKLTREDFKKDATFKGSDDWIYYNALGPLTAIYFCESDYLLYHTGDSFLEKPVTWVDKAIGLLGKKRKYKVANLTWNENYLEAKNESYKTKKDFFISNRGFSDQFFLVKTEDFRQPIYHSIHKDSHHFPRGDVFEKRVFSYMLDHGWKRITYSQGSYTHENF